MRKLTNREDVQQRMASWAAYLDAARRADKALRQWRDAASLQTAAPERSVRGSIYQQLTERCWQRFSAANAAAEKLYAAHCAAYRG